VVEIVFDCEGICFEALQPFREFLGAFYELPNLPHEGSGGRILVSDFDAEIQENELANIFLV
jgi:hypothetical protein